MDRPLKYSIGITAIIAIGAGVYFSKTNPNVHSPEAQATVPAVTAVTEASPPGERYPVPSQSSERLKALPESLETSDPTFQNALMALIGEDLFAKVFVSENLIRRMVVMVENATEKNLPLELVPYLPVPPPYPVIKREEEFFTDPPELEKRYRIYTDLILKADPKALVELYFHYYPLVQKAFLEIKPSGHFNDRLIQVIDHLESTPSVHGSKELLAYNRSYKFEELALEELSVSQKMLLRLGAASSEKVKTQLKKIRELIILGP